MSSEVTATEPTGYAEAALEALLALPERTGAAGSLAHCLQLQKRIIKRLKSESPIDSLEEATQLALTFVAASYHGVCALPQAAPQLDLLERFIVSSGCLLPFVGASSPTANFEFGVPSHDGPEVMCDSAAELVRVAGAALCSFFVYHNFAQQQPGSELPPDDALLLYTSLAIRSCGPRNPSAGAIEAELEAADLLPPAAAAADAQPGDSAPTRLSLGQLRWLMHWLRSELSATAGHICALLGDRTRQADYFAAHQQDCLALIKANPANPHSYLCYARAALASNQMQAAAVFAARGCALAGPQRHDAALSGLKYCHACALALGGGGGDTFDAAQVEAAWQEAASLAASSAACLPEPYRELAAVGGHEVAAAGKVVDKIREAAALIASAAAAADQPTADCTAASGGAAVPVPVPLLLPRLPVLSDFLYSIPPPKSLPPGALIAASGADTHIAV